MEKEIKDFLYLYEFGKNKSSNTIRALKKDLTQMMEYIVEDEKITSFGDITPLMLRSFINRLVFEEISNRSINRKLSSLRVFFKYLEEKRVIYHNPTETLLSPDFKSEKPDVLSYEEIQRFRDAIDTSSTNGLRDRLIIELLFSSGITSTELLSLGEKVFDLDKRELHIQYNHKNRVVFFSQRTREYLKKYIESKKKKYKDKYSPDILFVNGSSTRLSDRSLRRIIKRYAEKSGLSQEISPHTFRHTFGVIMLKKGMNPNYLKDLMGFETFESIKTYQGLTYFYNI